MRRLRVPLLADLTIEDRPDAVRAVAADQAFDRGYRARGPLLNRLLLGNIRRTLQFGGQPLPTVRLREDRGRAERHDLLWARLNTLAEVLADGPDELEELAGFVRGAGPEDRSGPLVQQAVGSLFSATYTASPETWASALMLDRAAHGANPLRQLWWRVSRQVEAAKQCLGGHVRFDLAGIHATGVALHHLVRGVTKMRELYADPDSAALDAATVASSCLFAPSVVRQSAFATADGPGRARGCPVVVLDLQAAYETARDPDLVFLRGTWSVCPAESWVPALLQGTWRRAVDGRPPYPPGPHAPSGG